MELSRVEEIMASPNKIDVTHNNTAVWIEDVFRDRQTAYVTVLGSCRTMEVPVGELKES